MTDYSGVSVYVEKFSKSVTTGLVELAYDTANSHCCNNRKLRLETISKVFKLPTDNS